MRIGYTEFSFGYAFTENLIRSSALAPKGAPVFPNLVQEATLGYDVNINLPGLPLFFQYKLPEIMKRNTAAEIATHQLPGFCVPFFRMPLMRRNLSQQHKKLIEWELKFPGTVLYASSCLHDIGEFNRSYSAGRVHEQSAFFSPKAIGPLPDDDDHVVSYRSGSTTAYFCSEPHKVEMMDYEVLSGKALELFHKPQFSTLDAASGTTRTAVRELVSSAMRNNEGVISERIRSRRQNQASLIAASLESEQAIENILVAREMARVDLGVDLLIAQPHK